MKQVQKYQQGNYFYQLNQRLNKTITDSQKKMSKYPKKEEPQKKEIKVYWGIPKGGKLAIKQKVDTAPGRKLMKEAATKLRDGIASVFDFINPSKLAYVDFGQTSPFAYSDFNWEEVRKGQQRVKEAADVVQSKFMPSTYVRELIPKEWQEDNPYMDLGLMAFDLWAGPKVVKGATKGVGNAVTRFNNPSAATWMNYKVSKKPASVEPIQDRVVYGNYWVDPSNPAHVNSLISYWKNKYPKSGAVFYDTPKVQEIGLTGRKVLTVGELPWHQDVYPIADLMKSRLENYPFREGYGPDIISTGHILTTKGKPGYMEAVKQRPNYLYIDLKPSGGVGGEFAPEGSYINLDPFREKPYIYTQVHEGLSHPTDALVGQLETPVSGQKVLGNYESYSMAKGRPNAEGMYGQISYPVDLFGKEALEFMENSSRKPIEARAVNWEMITKLYKELANKKGISFEQATKLPKQEFENFVGQRFSNVQELSNFMKRFNNQYLLDYSKLLDMGTGASKRYFNRILNGIKYLPAAVPFIFPNNAN